MNYRFYEVVFIIVLVLFKPFATHFNTYYGCYSTFVDLLKMEYGRNFWLKVSFSITSNSTYHEFEIPPCAKPFSNPLIYFIKVRILVQISNSVTKMTFFVHGGFSKKSLLF